MHCHSVREVTSHLVTLPDLYEFEQLRAGVKYGGNGANLTPESLRVLIEQAAERQSRRRKGNSGTNGSGGSQRQQGGNGGGREQHQKTHGNG
jgi:hypothetical protein